jgi:hypothetical protein
MDSNAVIVILGLVAAVVSVLIFAQEPKKKEIPRYTSPLNDPGYKQCG